MGSQLQSVNIAVNIRDTNGLDAKAVFGVRSPSLAGFTAIDGTGVLAGSTGKIEWTIIPTRDAAPLVPTAYSISGQISYIKDGMHLTIPLYPATITVFPEASLKVKYFVERDVYSDDPFTPEVEPAVPFSLGLIVTNAGMGSAKNFTITSSQPKIVDNEKGLLVAFQLIGTQVGAQQLAPSLTANLGNIAPGASAVALWRMTSTVQGQFIDYKASFKHLDDLGNERLSLVDSVEIHETNHVVRIDTPADDLLPDFLVNDQADDLHLPDTLHGSDGGVFPVSAVTVASVSGGPSPGNLQVQVTVTLPAGWSYLRINDPSLGNYDLVSVRRSDGRMITLGTNAWTTHRTLHPTGQPAQREDFLHLLDFNSTGSYTLTYALQTGGTIGPVVINEIMYRPPNGAGGADNTRDEFIELHNITTSAVDLSGWKLGRESAFTFPQGALIRPGEYLTVTSFDPQNAALAGAFRSIYGLGATTPLSGPYAPALANDTASVELFAAETVAGSPTTYRLIDRVTYAGVSPWPSAANGGGQSLQRINRSGLGGDAANWTGAAGTPGVVNASQTIIADSDGDGIPDTWEIAHGLDRYSAYDANIDTDGDGKTNREEFPAGTDPTDNRSVFAHTVTRSSDGYVIHFTAMSEHTYTILYRNSLGVGNWLKLVDIPAGPQRVMAVTDATTAAQRFYRVVTPSDAAQNPTLDSDGDDLPDAWEIAAGLDPHLAADAFRDADGDGKTNREEFFAGTNPNDPASVLVAAITGSSGAFTVKFTALVSRAYEVQYRDDLVAGGWQKLADIPAGLERVQTVTDSSLVPRRFYRVVTPPNP